MADHDHNDIDHVSGTATTGHAWDGIKELNTPLPRWWVITFYLTIIWAVGYWIVYPAWPLLSSNTKGLLSYSSRANLAVELADLEKVRGEKMATLATASLADIEKDPMLLALARARGKTVFGDNCAPCHGGGAAGAKGYPNLNDDDWLWGGDIKTIQQTLQHGVRQPGDEQTRMSQMPAFGRDGILKPEEVQDAVSYVRFVSHQEGASASSRRGATLFANNCAACHGDTAKGNRTFGAPNLTDAIWLYGGDRDTLTETVTNARYGIMPAWG